MDELDHLLQKRAAPLAVPDDLMARILADAAREQPRPALVARPAASPVRRPVGLWAVLSDLFGGAGALAGMATAACAGLYLGVAQPAAISNLAMDLTGSAAVDQLEFMPSIDTVLAGE